MLGEKYVWPKPKEEVHEMFRRFREALPVVAASIRCHAQQALAADAPKACFLK
jgi:hypothetical protein